MDAQVDVKPNQEPFVGGGTRMSRGNAAELEWITKHEVKLAKTFGKGLEPTRAETNMLNFWEQSN